MPDISNEERASFQAYRADMQKRNAKLDVENAVLRAEIENIRRALRLMRDRTQLGDQHYTVEVEVMGMLTRALARLDDVYGEKRPK